MRHHRKPTALWQIQLIAASMVTSLLAFSGVAIALGPLNKTPDETLTRTLLLALVGIGVAEIPVFWTLRKIMIAKFRRTFTEVEITEENLNELIPPLATLTILGCAMAESFGMFAAVILLLTGAQPAAIGVAVSLAALIKQFPSRGRLIRFAAQIENQA